MRHDSPRTRQASVACVRRFVQVNRPRGLGEKGAGEVEAFLTALANEGHAVPVTAHTFRDSFATHLIEAGDDIRAAQELPAYEDVSAKQIYTRALDPGRHGVLSPLDRSPSR
ncbi:tyrosine-type recombinase/integrase [Pseudoxanthomonas composti]|uniref:tyrosine-type recombinase/integrase n=1 Tax=Pseudoxanthomonas composti TaxID=2137479 RepID=UPI003CCCA7AA